MSNAPPLAEMPGHLIRRLNQHSTAVFQHHLKAAGHDITAVQFSTLKTLAQHPGLDQAGLAGMIEYDRATIGSVVKRLEDKDLLRRHPSKTDRRAFELFLTPAGTAVLAQVEPLVTALQDDILTALSREDRQQLVQLIQKALSLS